MQHWAQGSDICGRVTNWNLAVFLSVTVDLEITGCCFDERGSLASGSCSENLIADKEACNVWVALESVHDFLESCELSGIPYRVVLENCIGQPNYLGLKLRDGSIHKPTYLVNLRVESVQVDEGVDTSIRKCIHTRFVICGWIDMVDSNCIGSQSLHEGSIKTTLCALRQGISFNKLIGDSYTRTTISTSNQKDVMLQEDFRK